MNNTAFGLKVIGVALLLASSIGTVVLVAQRPKTSSVSAHVEDAPAARVSRN
jgi:hypothetical protein